MGNLTAFMIVRNEERLLPRCLDSLEGVVDRIVVLDTGSEDATREILRTRAGDPDRVPLNWKSLPFVDFGSARKRALELVESEWALWIDADEALSGPLRDELRVLRATGGLESRDIWEFPLENRVLGRVMRGRNLAGQTRPRLFRTNRAGFTDSAVHEGLEFAPGTDAGLLTGPLLHDTMTGWRRYLRKVDLYTTLEAGDPARRFAPLHLLVTGPATLWREFVWRGGWRDGYPGFVWAATTAWSSLLRDWKLLLRALGRPVRLPR